MKNKIYILLILLWELFISSCNSPLNVPANREIHIKEDPYSNPLITISPTFINFDFVHPDMTKTMEVTISNNQNKKLLINDYYLFFGNNSSFYFANKSVPFILESKGEPNSSQIITVEFKGKSPSVYNDTLYFSSIFYPSGLIEAKVPYIYADELTFDNVKLGSNSTNTLKIYNLSEYPAIINSMILNDNADLFTINTSFPIELPRNSSKEISITFTPKAVGKTQTSVQFSITTLSKRRLIDSLSHIYTNSN
jgi:hypothetical protein